MSVYIKGMEMPKVLGKTITIFPNGMVRVWVNNKGSGELLEQRAVPVSPHGRLIDADEIWTEINKIGDRRDAGIISDLGCLQKILSAVRCAPTIIPADKEEI